MINVEFLPCPLVERDHFSAHIANNVMALGQEFIPKFQLSSPCLSYKRSSWKHVSTLAIACPYSLSICRVRFSERSLPQGPSSARKLIVEKLWREFFSDPSQWWDHRPEKENPKYPDFIHKKTQQSLWLNYHLTPPWVKLELAAMAPGTIQSHIFSWHVRLRRHVRAGDYKKTMELFQQMQAEGIIVDKFTFAPVLKAISGLRTLEKGRRVHEQIVQRGCESDVYVSTCLVDMYAKCGSIEDARKVFNKMVERTVVSWNAMIGGYVKSGQGLKAMEIFQMMEQEGVEPNAVTFLGLLNACASLEALEEGRRVHEQVIKRGLESDVYVANCLVDMYAKCGSIDDAWSVFNKARGHNVVAWNAMIGGYVKSGQGLKAIELFWKMQQEGFEANAITFIGVLNACASVAALEEGRRVHEQISQKGFVSDVYVANCLVDMYAKCGNILDAWSVFDKMPKHDLVSWNAIIGGYVKSEQGLKALELFQEMQQEGVEPDTITFVVVLNACASVAALEEGRRVHERIIQSGCESDVYIATCLVDMYANCGSIEDAWTVFNKVREHNVVFWSTMIRGYAMHGHAKKAIGLFKRMGKEGLEIDGITFICLLSACSHGGLVKEGLRFFQSMASCFDIHPTEEHYACIVDLLARAGQLGKVEEFIERMPIERGIFLWMSLLGSCRIYGNIKIAERAAQRCWELDPGNTSGHVLLSNLYAAAGKWDRGVAIDEDRLERKVTKEPGQTWIEVNN